MLVAKHFIDRGWGAISHMGDELSACYSGVGSEFNKIPIEKMDDFLVLSDDMYLLE